MQGIIRLSNGLKIKPESAILVNLGRKKELG